MSYSRVSLHRRQDGAFITTIHTETVRSWVKNDYGECDFPLSQSDFKAVRKYLELGTLVYIEHDDLPPWGGKILPPFSFNDDGEIVVKAYSGEAFFRLRRTPWSVLWKANSAGALFRRFVVEANRVEDLLIRPGAIWEGGSAAEDTQDGRLMFDHIQALVKNRKHVWSVEPVLDKEIGRLYWEANYAERMGVDLDFWLKEGLNLEKRSQPLRLQRWPVNDLFGIGQGSDGNRPVFNAIDAESRARYGLMQGSQDFDNIDLAGVKANTLATLKEVRHPRETWQLTLLNKNGVFRRARTGNTLPLKTQTIGFFSDNEYGNEGRVEVIGMRYSDNSDKMDINTDTVFYE